MRISVHMGAALALMVALGTPLSAQTPAVPESRFSADLKLHFGWTPQNKDQLRHDYQAIGVDFGYRTDFGRLGLELGWNYKAGDGFVNSVGPDPASPRVPVDRDWSGDSRRNDLNGLMTRLSLTRPLTESIDWQAGIQVGGTLWNQQYFGDIRGGYQPKSKPGPTWAWRDLYNGNLKGHYVGISPFAGVKFDIGHNGGLEVNLMLLNYQAREYVHLPGTASAYVPGKDSSGRTTSPTSAQNDCPLDTSTSAKRYVPHIEITYVYHF